MEAVRDGRPVDLGGARQRTLLALLAVRAGTPVSTDALIDALWGGEPPEGAETTIRSYVSRLRAALGDGPTISRGLAGYALAIDPEDVDASRFERLVARGLQLAASSRHGAAAAALQEAVDLWRGDPFAGLPADGPLGATATRLQELRLDALEARLGAELELGRSGELVDGIEALLAENPLREGLWRHLMLALYRSGRQADALAAFQRASVALDDIGVDPGPELQTLQGAILRHEVAAPAAVAPRSTGLPAPLTRFIGRDVELDEVRRLLQRARLVTLVGIGGAGKTRLAIEAAKRFGREANASVGFVDLAAIEEEALLPGHIAGSLQVRDGAGRSPLQALVEHIGQGPFLLVLDNCEHVRDAAAHAASVLLRGAPELRVLATTRELLGIEGEASYPVPPLEVPDASSSVEALRESDAVRLLMDRVSLVRGSLHPDDTAYETAARICRDLEGLPLAIELAAARAHVLSLEEIAVRLRDRFQFLVSWRRLTSARHRTLREAMDWSHALLQPDEQRLFASLSVFPGDFSLASASAVCLEDRIAEAERLLERLVDASLVVPAEVAGATRYRLLETVREYAAGHVDPAVLSGLQHRLASRIRDVAESTNLASDTRRRGPRDFELARMELPAIRASIGWAREHAPALGIEIAAALESFWTTDAPGEGLATFAALLERPDVPDALRARAFRCQGACRYALGDFEAGEADFEQALALFREPGVRPQAANVTLRLAIIALNAGRLDRAAELLEKARTMAPGERLPRDIYISLGLASELARHAGDLHGALDLARQESDAALDAGDHWWHTDTLLRIAGLEIDLQRFDAAAAAARQGLLVAHAIPVRGRMLALLATLARLAALQGDPERAGRLWGGIDAEVARSDRDRPWELEADARRAEVAAIAGDAFEPAAARGRALSLDQLIAEAVGQSTVGSASVPPVR